MFSGFLTSLAAAAMLRLSLDLAERLRKSRCVSAVVGAVVDALGDGEQRSAVRRPAHERIPRDASLPLCPRARSA